MGNGRCVLIRFALLRDREVSPHFEMADFVNPYHDREPGAHRHQQHQRQPMLLTTTSTKNHLSSFTILNLSSYLYALPYYNQNSPSAKFEFGSILVCTWEDMLNFKSSSTKY